MNALFIDKPSINNVHGTPGLLTKTCFTHDVLREHLICFASDGASVMVGRTAGFAQAIAKSFSNVLTWHYANHRLELAVDDAVNDIGAVSHFKIFLDKLYSLYSCSPKNRAKLEVAAAEVSEQVHKIGIMLDTIAGFLPHSTQ